MQVITSWWDGLGHAPNSMTPFSLPNLRTSSGRDVCCSGVSFTSGKLRFEND